MASITAEERSQLTALFVGMFNAAPGATNLSAMVAAFEGGKTLNQIAADLATRPEFALVYPGLLTGSEFANKLADALLPAGTPAGARTWGVNWVITNLNAGATKAAVISEAVKALKVNTNPDFQLAEDLMNNKVAVAEYYSITKLQSDSDLADLQAVLVGVTEVAASVATAQATIDTNIAIASGQTFTLSTGQDIIVGTGGNDVVKGIFGSATLSENTVTAGDSIDGGLGNDVMELTVQGTTASSAAFAVKNVESLMINDLVGGTFNALSVEGTPTITFANTQTGITSMVTNAGLASTYGLSGKGNLTLDFAVTSGTDTAKVSLAGAGTSTTARSTVNVADGNTIEAVTVATSGSNFVSLTSGTAAGTLTVTGTGTNNLDVSSLKTVATIDASTSTGANTFVMGSTLSNGDVVKGGTGADTVTFTGAAAVGSVTLTSVETLTGVINADLSLNLGTSTGLKTLNVSNSIAAMGGLSVTNATKELATVNITAQTSTVNDFGLSYKTGDTGAVTVNVGSTATTAANITMDDFTFTRIGSLTLNAVGTKDITITDDITINDSSDVAFTASVAADGELSVSAITVESLADVNLSVGASGDLYIYWFDTSDTSGGIGDFNLTLAENASGSVDYLEASGAGIGDVTVAVGSGGSAYVSAYTSGHFSAGVSGDIGDITVTVASGGSASVSGFAQSGSVGDVFLHVGADTSGWLHVSASGYSGIGDDDYSGGGNIGNITVWAIGNSAYASASASAGLSYESGNTGEGGNIGDMTLVVTGTDSYGYINASGASGGSMGNVNITLDGSGYAYVSADSDEEESAGGNIGTTTATLTDSGYIEIDLNASGSVGNISVMGASASGADVDIYAYGNSGDVGTINVTFGESAYVYVNSSAGSGDTGDITITVGADSDVSAYASAGETTGSITITAGTGSEVDVNSDSDNGNMGSIKVTGGEASDAASAFASGASIDSVDLAGWLGTYTINLGTVDVGTIINGGAGGGTITGTDGSDVITGGAKVDTINGGTGADVIAGAGGNDIINGEAGADVIDGGTGNDTIDGGADADVIDGGTGNDNITGGAGADVLTGGTGNDTFSIGTDVADTVEDLGSGDVLDLDGIVNITRVYQEVATVAGDITTDANVIVYGGVTTIAAAAAAIAADSTVTGTTGIIVVSDGTKTYVYSTTDLGADGTETLRVTLTGIVDPLSLVETNFDVTV